MNLVQIFTQLADGAVQRGLIGSVKDANELAQALAYLESAVKENEILRTNNAMLENRITALEREKGIADLHS